ncbi:hypothetical protein [Glycomyces salinus]|uniref:hypothetical protein n=1 Tax=Glycomyces salinus TaxID=980294 RepID=UPI0018EADFDC|nr:hypothetical protein [Glycomyces salinus]
MQSVLMPMRMVALGLCAAAVLAASACTIRVGDDEDGPGAAVFGDENSIRWDLARPLESEPLGLPPDQMVVATVPEDATVTLDLPHGTWSGRVEEMTVTTRDGYIDSVDLFWTETDGQAAADRMAADAESLGLDAEQVAAWAEVASWAETADSNRARHKADYHGSNGEVATSVATSMAMGAGTGTPCRLWYKFYVRDVVDPG